MRVDGRVQVRAEVLKMFSKRALAVVAIAAGCSGMLTSVAAQVSNSPLFEPSPMLATPTWSGWQGVQDGRGVWAPQVAPQVPYTPPARYPTDSRNLSLDNRAPTLRDVSPRLGSSLENGAPGNGVWGAGVRRSEGFQSPAAAEPARPSWR
jgi:hypothetical protein